MKVAVDIVDGLERRIRQHAQNNDRADDQCTEQCAEHQIFLQARGHILYCLCHRIVDDGRLSAADDLIDLVDTDIHQRICDIPAQLRIIAGHLDIHDMCGVRIVYGDERSELLVIEIQVELVNDAVQHCAALDDVRIVVGQRR